MHPIFFRGDNKEHKTSKYTDISLFPIIPWSKNQDYDKQKTAQESTTTKSKKTHICEGGGHLRISFWHLLMNLKNSFLCIWLLANQIYKNLNIYNLVFFLKRIKKNNTQRYHYFIPVYQKSWGYDLQFLKYSVMELNW